MNDLHNYFWTFYEVNLRYLSNWYKIIMIFKLSALKSIRRYLSDRNNMNDKKLSKYKWEILICYSWLAKYQKRSWINSISNKQWNFFKYFFFNSLQGTVEQMWHTIHSYIKNPHGYFLKLQWNLGNHWMKRAKAWVHQHVHQHI